MRGKGVELQSYHIGASSVHVCLDKEELSLALAEAFVLWSCQAVESTGRSFVALSGGSTPKNLYELLAQQDFAARIDWSKVHLFLGDERCVPLDHVESNFNMVRQTLVSKLQIPFDNVHALVEPDKDPRRSASEYEAVLKKLLPRNEAGIPRFDLILLGLGPDGHTASLFPGTSALGEKYRWVVPNFVPKFNTYRITFTLPVLNAASHIAFMVAGADKKEILPLVVKDEPVLYPAQMVRPSSGRLEWYVDQDAASCLTLNEN